jgi:tetratricopeptide (TPR) repeat protein
MNLLTRNKPKTYSLLSIGHRGVGKTVFLTGSFVELDRNSKQKNTERVWLECQDRQSKANVLGILDYIGKNSQYPPATMKITTFNFDLKQRSLIGEKTICHFRWWDVPGESCNINHPDFQKIVLGSHSCCLFINAYELINQPNYLASLEPIIKQVIAIASLVSQHQMFYAFAVILTQCDRVDTSAIGKLKIEEKLQPLMARFNLVKVNCRQFYSAIALQEQADRSQLKPEGAAAPLLWLASELNQAKEFQLYQNLETGINEPSPRSRRRSQPSWLKFILPPVALGLILAIAPILFSWHQSNSLVTLVEQTNSYLEQGKIDLALPLMEKIVLKDPNNVDWQLNLANVYELKGQTDKALPLMEKISLRDPNNADWQIKLANLYEAKSKYSEAEKIYDRILAQKSDDLNALLRKALLRTKQKDLDTARILFQRAEKAAPTDEIKTKVRSIAANFL